MVIYLAISGGTFLFGVIRNAGRNEPLTVLLFGAVLIWLTLLITVVCMRLFAEERKSGTLETLMTAPVSEAQVVLGKYAGALSFVILVTAPTISFIYILAGMSPGVAEIDTGALAGGAFVTMLVSALCVALGMVLSLITKNQIVSAISIFCAIWCLLLAGNIVSSFPEWMQAGTGEYFSILNHVEDFSRGSIDTRPIVVYVTGTVFLLFVAVRMLESRRWR